MQWRTMANFTGMQPQQSSLCVVLPPIVHASTHTRRRSGLLMVHGMLTLAVKVWLYGMEPIDKPYSRESSASLNLTIEN